MEYNQSAALLDLSEHMDVRPEIKLVCQDIPPRSLLPAPNTPFPVALPDSDEEMRPAVEAGVYPALDMDPVTLVEN